MANLSKAITAANNTLIGYKSYPLSATTSFYEYLYQQGEYDLVSHVALKYYTKAAPVYAAIDLICTEISAIIPVLYDTRREVYISSHPFLDLLQYPNADSTYTEFIYAYAAYYLTTGNSFNIATGPIGRPPLELFAANPQRISITPHNVDLYADIINYSAGGAIEFLRKEIGNRFRYYNEQKTAEIWQTKTFNPSISTKALYGLSKLNALTYEIEQYLESSIHNLSLLEKGGRPSGAFTTDARLSDDQLTRIQQQFNTYQAGAKNAGRILVFDGAEMDYKEMSQSNKDMDFANLKQQVTMMIYNALRIPLPLMSEGSMTMNNMSHAKLNLYDNAVLPIINRLFSELAYFLLPRYPKSENLILTYNPSDMIALEPRRNEELQKLSSLGVLTINELRSLIGYEEVEGGDDIYAPSTEIPIAHDADSLDTIATDNSATSRETFTDIMRQQVDQEGDRLFTDDEIERIADRNNLT